MKLDGWPPDPTLLVTWAVGAVACAAVMAVLWCRQLATRDATAVDVAWSALLGVLALSYALVGTAPEWRRVLLALVAGAWSTRLSLHLLRDRLLARRGEDGRYSKLRASWGTQAPRNFFVLYQAQAALAALLSLPFLLVAFHAAERVATAELVGLAVVLAGLCGETIADRQLAAHRSDPARAGRTCRRGLWAWSRHPNYFFEWCQWLGFALLAWPAPLGFAGMLAPALLLWLILKVTGIPPTEAQAARSRPDYAAYQRSTSAFVPWPPRRAARVPPDTTTAAQQPARPARKETA